MSYITSSWNVFFLCTFSRIVSVGDLSSVLSLALSTNLSGFVGDGVNVAQFYNTVFLITF